MLVVLLTVFMVLLLNRRDIDVNILRSPGMLFQEQPGNLISNLYNIEVVNKTFNKIPIELKLENRNGEIKIIGNSLNIEPNGIADAKFMVLLPKDELDKTNSPLQIGVYSQNKKIDEISSSFLGPYKK